MLFTCLLFCFISVNFALQCKNNKDCDVLKTVCQPSFYCDSKGTKQCKSVVKLELCASEKERARLFNQNWSHHGNIGIQCSVESSQCIVVYYCTEDAECDDTLYCNGQERCISGQCERNSNFSAICAQCNESDRCGSSIVTTTSSNSTSDSTGTALLSETAIITVLSVFTVIAFCAVVAMLYWLFSRKAKQHKRTLI
jgi:hypothetical protein